MGKKGKGKGVPFYAMKICGGRGGRVKFNLKIGSM